MKWRRAIPVGVLVVACGKSATDSGTLCSIGDTRECLGPGRCEGAQECLADRSGYGECLCEASDSDDGSSMNVDDDSSGSFTADQHGLTSDPESSSSSASSGDVDNPVESETLDETEGTEDDRTSPNNSIANTSGTSDGVVEGTDDVAVTDSIPEDSVPNDEITLSDTPDAGTTDDCAALSCSDETSSPPENPDVPDGVPVLMILADNTTSMFASSLPNGSSAPFDTLPDSWEAQRTGISALEPFASDMLIWLAKYYATSEQCPIVESLETPPSLGDFQSVQDALPPSAEAIPASKTNSTLFDALELAYSALSALDTSGSKQLLVITDGPPGSLCDFVDQGVYCGRDPVFAVAQNAFVNGIVTRIVVLQADTTGFAEGLAHAGTGNPVESLQDLGLPCVAGEAMMRGEENFDYDNWRASALASYAADGYTYPSNLAFSPTTVSEVNESMTTIANELLSP